MRLKDGQHVQEAPLLRRFGDAIDLGAQTVQRPLDLLVRRVLMENLEELQRV